MGKRSLCDGIAELMGNCSLQSPKRQCRESDVRRMPEQHSAEQTGWCPTDGHRISKKRELSECLEAFEATLEKHLAALDAPAASTAQGGCPKRRKVVVHADPSKGCVTVHIDPRYLRLLLPRYPQLLQYRAPVHTISPYSGYFSVTLTEDLFRHIVRSIVEQNNAGRGGVRSSVEEIDSDDEQCGMVGVVHAVRDEGDVEMEM